MGGKGAFGGAAASALRNGDPGAPDFQPQAGTTADEEQSTMIRQPMTADQASAMLTTHGIDFPIQVEVYAHADGWKGYPMGARTFADILARWVFSFDQEELAAKLARLRKHHAVAGETDGIRYRRIG